MILMLAGSKSDHLRGKVYSKNTATRNQARQVSRDPAVPASNIQDSFLAVKLQIGN